MKMKPLALSSHERFVQFADGSRHTVYNFFHFYTGGGEELLNVQTCSTKKICSQIVLGDLI